MTTRPFAVGGAIGGGRLGFGAMQLPTGPEHRAASVAVVRRAVELGATLIDTAYLYGWGANEELLVEALHPYPAGVLVTTKVGVVPAGPPDGARLDGRPEVLRRQVEQARRRLRLERIDLLQLHRVDPEVPLADQVGVLRELQIEGSIAHVGLSEVTVAQLDEARRTIAVASVQNRYNVVDRGHDDVLDACTAAGIAFLPWRPVLPAVGAAGAIAEVAAELSATAAQVSLAWLLARSPVVVPIPGTSSIAHLEENMAAADLHLTADQTARLDLAGAP